VRDKFTCSYSLDFSLASKERKRVRGLWIEIKSVRELGIERERERKRKRVSER